MQLKAKGSSVIGLKTSGHETNAVVTCEIKLFQNYFSLRRVRQK